MSRSLFLHLNSVPLQPTQTVVNTFSMTSRGVRYNQSLIDTSVRNFLLHCKAFISKADLIQILEIVCLSIKAPVNGDDTLVEMIDS